MVAELAVSSVEKKLEMQASVIVGNYEFYYASGKLASVAALQADETTAPMELKEAVTAALEGFVPSAEDDNGIYLKRLLERYRPAEEYDEQMDFLFRWGREGRRPENAQ